MAHLTDPGVAVARECLQDYKAGVLKTFQDAHATKQKYAGALLRVEAGTHGLADAQLREAGDSLRQQLQPHGAQVIDIPVVLCSVSQQAPFRGHVFFCLTEGQAKRFGGEGSGMSCIADAVVKALAKPEAELAHHCLRAGVADLDVPCATLKDDPPLRPKVNMFGYLVDHGGEDDDPAVRAAAVELLLESKVAAATALMYNNVRADDRPSYAKNFTASTRLVKTGPDSLGMAGLASWGKDLRAEYWDTPSYWRAAGLGLILTDGHLEDDGAYCHGLCNCDVPIVLGMLNDMRVLRDKSTTFDALVKFWQPQVADGIRPDRLPLLQFQTVVKCRKGFVGDTKLQEMVPWGDKTSLFNIDDNVEEIM